MYIMYLQYLQVNIVTYLNIDKFRRTVHILLCEHEVHLYQSEI